LNTTSILLFDLVVYCTLEFFDFEGYLLSTQVVNYGRDIEFPVLEDRVGYAFIGWNPYHLQAIDHFTFHPVYEINKHTLRFYVEEDLIELIENVPYGEAIVYPAFSQVGYTVVWDQNLESMPDEDVDITGELVLNRHWVFFYVNDILYHSQEYAYGEAIIYPNVDVDEGYFFTSWDLGFHETMIDSDLIITGYILPIETE
jgi:hypothetical protein